MIKTVYLYVFDTLADWEPGFAVAELQTGRFFRKSAGRCQVKTVGLSTKPVVTMGGIRILPDLPHDACTPEGSAMLILPGGLSWMEACHDPILRKAGEFIAARVPVAGICGATVALANAGFLDHRYHTSNELGYLQTTCPHYAGTACYRQKPVVTDQGLTTASGTAAVDFACEIFRVLDVMAPKTIEAWRQLHLTHEPRCFADLMASLQGE